MIVYYRMCDIPSTNPSPILQDNKMELNKLCLKSFVRAFKDVNPKIVFICDFCPESYREMIEELCPFDKEIIFTTAGINETMLMSYKMALEQDDDVLFQECDYFYRDSGEKMVSAVKQLGLVSPYDHLNFYLDRSIHSPNANLRLVNGQHWRSTERNTMTFAVRNDIFKKFYEVFYKYGYLDNEVWIDIAINSQHLHVPIPAIATHMVRDYLSPGVDWEAEWKKLM